MSKNKKGKNLDKSSYCVIACSISGCSVAYGERRPSPHECKTIIQMRNYNYREAICEDIRNWLRDRDEIAINEDNRDDVIDAIEEELWISDSVTGNASGSYWFNAWKAEEALCHNMDLWCEAMNEFGYSRLEWRGAEIADVAIRCYLLRECLELIIDDELCRAKKVN